MTDAPTGTLFFVALSALGSYLLLWPLRPRFHQIGVLGKIIIFLLLGLTIFFAAVMILWWAAKYHLSRPESDLGKYVIEPPWVFWLQVVVGKYLPGSAPYPTRSFAYSLSAVLAFVLSFGPLAGTITVIWTYGFRPLLKRRTKMMQDTMAFLYRDEVLKLEFRNLVSELFKNGDAREAVRREANPMDTPDFLKYVDERIGKMFVMVGTTTDRDLTELEEESEGDEKSFLHDQKEKFRAAYPPPPRGDQPRNE
jgi:hypothetical protein